MDADDDDDEDVDDEDVDDEVDEEKKEVEYLGVVGRKLLRTARFSSGSRQWVGSSLSFIALNLEHSNYQVC